MNSTHSNEIASVARDLLAPHSWDFFFEEFYEKKPLLVASEKTSRFSSLLDLNDIDHAITNLSLKPPQIRLVNADEEKGLTDQDYVGPGGIADPSRVFTLFDQGATIIISQLHRQLPRLADFCRCLETEFSQPFQTNIYVTPAGAKGFKPHYDTHDVFILQISGSKDWQIYDAPIGLPLSAQPHNPEIHQSCGEPREFQLSPGDVVYIPRGFIHEARCTDEVSLHITTGILSVTWTDFVLDALGDLCLSDRKFRTNLPLGFARNGYDRSKARKKFALLMKRFQEKADFDRSFDHFVDEFVGNRPSRLSGQLKQIVGADRITAGDTFAPRQNLIYRLVDGNEKIVLKAFGTEIEFPGYVAETLRAALTMPRYQTSTLPGELDTESKLVLIRRLIKEGLVEKLF